MTKKITWPITWDNLETFHCSPDKKNFCDICFYDLSYEDRSVDFILHYVTIDSFPEKSSKFTDVQVCNACEKQLTDLRPNPYTIPNLPNLGDVTYTSTMTKALDDVFMSAYIFHNRQEWVKKNPDVDVAEADKWEIRNSFFTYPSFYHVNKNRLENVTYRQHLNIKVNLDLYVMGITIGTAHGFSQSAKMNIKKLVKQLDICMERALTKGVVAREKAIEHAREVYSTLGDRPTFEIRVVEDDSNNRGMVYVNAFEINESADQQWKRTFATFRTDISVYVNVVDGVPTLSFHQDVNDGNSSWSSVKSVTLEDAIEQAHTSLNNHIENSNIRHDNQAVYAREALEAVGIPLVDEEEK